MTEKAKIDTETICKQTSSNRENKKCPIQTKISKTARGGPTKKLGVRSLNTIKISTKCPPPRCVYAERDFRHMSIMMVSIGQGNWHLRYRRPAGSIWTPPSDFFHYFIIIFFPFSIEKSWNVFVGWKCLAFYKQQTSIYQKWATTVLIISGAAILYLKTKLWDSLIRKDGCVSRLNYFHWSNIHI